ncbi:hypothetical protein FQZ97_1117840 [compost metagenome]
MNIPQGTVHHSSIHFREPVVHPGDHGEEGGRSHYEVEVCHYKIGIMQLDIQSGIPQDDTGQTSRNKEGYHTDSKQHGRRKDQVSSPEGSDIVKSFHRRRNGNDQC